MLNIPENLHLISDAEAESLCAALRARLVEVTAVHGGHLASNLGAVELTVALHRTFAPERDRIVFDVGHQCYCHKMLTGRDGAMDTLRTFGGLSGFPKPAESFCDAFVAGHASTAVSAAVGMARARTLRKEDYRVIALLGDGALSGGLAYEGLSDAGDSGEPLLVILNDNGMSITQNVGGVAEYLARQRLKPQYLSFKKGYRKLMTSFPVGRKVYRMTHKVKTAVKDTLLPCSLFEDMGFTYLGPVDGHDVGALTQLMTYAKELPGPVLLHVRTVKGKGYPPAEAEPDRFHGVGPFDPATGSPLKASGPSFSSAFGEALCKLAERDEKVCAVTAAMCPGTGLTQFAKKYPRRFFDVGIAEGHAVTMCAGMAKQGMVPVFAVYSTFLQRAYDMILHDVALQNLHVVFCVDRAGLVGEDGETHHGVFDAAFLDTVPGMKVMAPANFEELENMLEYAVHEVKGPVAIRYPRGGEGTYKAPWDKQAETILRQGTDAILIGYGTLTDALLEAADRLEREGISTQVVKLNILSPAPTKSVIKDVQKFKYVFCFEEIAAQNCVGQRLAAALALSGAPARHILLQNLGDKTPTQGTVAQLRRLYGLDAESMAQQVREVLAREEASGHPAG